MSTQREGQGGATAPEAPEEGAGAIPSGTAESPATEGAEGSTSLGESVHPLPPSPHPPERQRWRPSNLTLRLLTAGILIPPVIWLCYRGGLPFVAAVAVFNLVAINEFYNFISAKGATAHRLLGTVAAVILPFVAYVGDTFYATSLLTAVLLTVMILQLTRAHLREAIVGVSATFFGVFYVGWLLSHAVSVRFIQRDLVRRYGESAAGHIDPQIGFFFMLLCLVAAVICDTGAYFVGSRYGRRKLARTISPNKTIEGAFGGVIAGAVGAILTKLAFDHLVPGGLSWGFPYVAAGLFGIAIASVAILGDLIESILKRDAELKDAGQILPGVGGVLDRIDSALLAIPVTYYLLLAYYYFALSI